MSDPTAIAPTAAADAWRELAAALVDVDPPCAGAADLWFDGDPAVAASACSTCPALQPCRRYGEAADERSGVWGGVDRSRRTRKAA